MHTLTEGGSGPQATAGFPRLRVSRRQPILRCFDKIIAGKIVKISKNKKILKISLKL